MVPAGGAPGAPLTTATAPTMGESSPQASTITVTSLTSELRPVLSVATTPSSYAPALSAVKVGLVAREFERMAAEASGFDRTDHCTVDVCAAPQAMSASVTFAFSCTAAFGWVVPGVAVAVTDGVAAPQLATLTVNVFTALARPVESVTISRTT